MKLKVLDQILVSSVSSETLRPQQEIEVSDELGKELLDRHPSVFEAVGAKAKAAPANKAEKAAPANKAKAPAKRKRG